MLLCKAEGAPLSVEPPSLLILYSGHCAADPPGIKDSQRSFVFSKLVLAPTATKGVSVTNRNNCLQI